ncbi:hypothetical protein T01_15254 [Trichinella spiralis]|uniref:Uncharacterized protein n=1 Tax=Trichinella spiralis TaxID=6334 RepID=A0A0V1AI99_TRISP|nr:hypothetical protein T01_15254 [Trichinella spiralis]
MGSGLVSWKWVSSLVSPSETKLVFIFAKLFIDSSVHLTYS